MSNWIIISAPLLIAAVVLVLAFVGCGLDVEGTGVALEYRDQVTNTPSIVSYWRLGEAPGATVAADSKDGNAGAYKGGVTLGEPGLMIPASNSEKDTAARFDGTSGYVSAPHKDASLNPPKFTVEALVRIDGGDGKFRAVVSSRDVVSNHKFGYQLFVSDANRWEARAGDGTTGVKTATVGKVDAVKVGGGPARGPFYVAMTYDGTKLTLNVNPIDQNDPDQVASVPVALKPNTKNELRIGAGTNELAVPQFFFDGVIDEVAVYNDALDWKTMQAHFAVMMTSFKP